MLKKISTQQDKEQKTNIPYLEHSEIKSPIDGRIGKALVSVGNYVNSSTGKLARIVQTSPIRIAFSVSDKERLMIMKDDNVCDDAFVEIVLPNGDVNRAKTENVFVDNEVDPSTATIPVYLDVDNSDDLLVPGNYVDIYIHFEAAKNAILIVEFAKDEMAKGATIIEAAKTGLKERFRAVMMTAFAFILGVFPMVIASGVAAESRKAIGVPVFYGMLAATAVGVLIIPLMYVLVQSLYERFKNRKKN